MARNPDGHTLRSQVLYTTYLLGLSYGPFRASPTTHEEL